MKRLILSVVTLLFTFSAFSQRRIGANLADISNFSSQIIYVDVMHASSEWIAAPADDLSIFEVEGAMIPLGVNNYPTHSPFEFNNQMLLPHVAVLNSQPEGIRYPSGEYTLIFEGQGEIMVRWDVGGGSFTADDPAVPHTFQVEPSNLGLNLVIMQSDANDPVRNIRLVLPGFADVYETEPFHPDFLSLLEPFDVLRFMKPLAVEENTVVEWEDRTQVDNYTYVTDDTERIRFGMPYEHIILLANSQQQDVWINVPPFANDEYIQEMAALFADQLDEGIHLHIEFSNESWNTLYPVTRAHMIEQGRQMGFGDDELEANMRYHHFRSFQIWKEFEKAFDERSDQIVKVLGSWSFVDAGRISIDAIKDPMINPDGILPDGIAVAVYMGIETVDQMIADFGVGNFTADQLLDRLEQTYEQDIDDFMPQFEFWADSTGIELMAYEGGQHLSIGNFGENPEVVAEVVAEANRSERLGTLYCNLFDKWYDEYNGGLFMSFVLAESYGLGGSFGILESTLQDPATSEKWQTHVECAFPAGPPVLEIVGSLSFDITNVGETSVSSFVINNTGESDLVVDQVVSPETFSTSWAGGTITAGDSQLIAVSFSPTHQQTYSGNIVINSNIGEVSIPVSGQGMFVTGIEFPDTGREINIYPNPVKALATFDFQNINGPVSVQVLDSHGLVIMSGDFSGGQKVTMDLSNVPQGLFLAQIIGVGYEVYTKILIER